MIRELKTKEFSINVKLKSGAFFENRDIPNSPFGEYERMVSFWHNDKLRVYSIEEVEFCELIPEESE